MKKDVLIWASAHKPTTEQIKELEKMGRLEYIDECILERMSDIKVDTDLEKLMDDVLDSCDNITPYDYILVQPAGSPKFQWMLGDYRVQCLYAFSERRSEDIPQADGSVKKVSIFKHICFQ